MLKKINYKDYTNYLVDEYGNVYSLPQLVIKSNGVKQPRKGKKLSIYYCSDGYPKVKISKDGKCESVAIHILVAKAFIPNPDNLPEVNHIDCNRKNCYYKNLEWVTHSQNVAHSYKLGHYEKPQFRGKGNPRARKVKNLTDGLVFDTIGECAEWLISNNYTSGGIDNARSEISKACKTHKKYLSKEFKFV